MKIKSSVKKVLAGSMMAMIFSVSVLAASESLNGGGATWSGGENSDGILYSKLVDNEEDGIQYSVTVWVKSDDGISKEKSGTTDAVGSAGQVYVSKAATHKNPFVAEKCGYNSFVAKSTK